MTPVDPKPPPPPPRAPARSQSGSAASAALLDTLLTAAPLGHAFFDLDLRFVRVNPALARLNGRSVEEHLGRTLRELVPAVAETMEPSMRRVLETGEPVLDAEVSLRDPTTGQRGTALVSQYPVRDADGTLRGLAVTVMDITARKRREEHEHLLAEAGQVFSAHLSVDELLPVLARLCVPALADWAVVWLREPGAPPRLALAHADPSARPTLRSLAEGASQRLRWRLARLGEGRRAFRLDAEALAAHLRALDADGALPEHHDERKKVCAIGAMGLLAVPLPAGGDRVRGGLVLGSAMRGRAFDAATLGLAEELGRRAGLALENARLLARMRLALQSRQDLVSFVSHDLSTPLLAVDTTATLLELEAPEGPAGARVRERAAWIREAAGRMRRLVGDLLDVGRLEHGRLALRLGQHPVGALVRDALSAHAPLAQERGVELSAGPLPAGARVLCDAERVQQVLANLLSNAIRFAPPGTPVRLDVTRSGPGVRFEVHDEGPGIPPEDQPYLFQRLWRGTAPKQSWPGLGLYIARLIVEAHGGRIGLTPRHAAPGAEAPRGSVFHFTLPATFDG